MQSDNSKLKIPTGIELDKALADLEEILNQCRWCWGSGCLNMIQCIYCGGSGKKDSSQGRC